MLWKLLVPFSEVQAGNKSENLLNKIRQIIYYLYKQAKLLKKMYNNIMNSIKV